MPGSLLRAGRRRNTDPGDCPDHSLAARRHLVLAAEGRSTSVPFRPVIENLIGNAWQYTATPKDAWIHFGSRRDDNKTVFFVEDNGIGFDMRYAAKLFSPFQRLHGAEFDATGIGLASMARTIRRHGGNYRGDRRSR